MEAKPQQITQAKRRIDDLLGSLHYDTTSLTHLLVKAFRAGMPTENAANVYKVLRETIEASETAFNIAVAQPENRMAERPQVVL